MTANYPASILPPNATAVERAIDRASAAALARIPVYLIRWVKDPDSCPLALLPWLAWEYQVDTWNINWSEQKKRDAIKRAHYIHRHRGTVAAVRHALVDSPFGTDIVEWFNQNPKGDPYTFRLNVYQNDLPVTEYDQQDLKLAVSVFLTVIVYSSPSTTSRVGITQPYTALAASKRYSRLSVPSP